MHPLLFLAMRTGARVMLCSLLCRPWRTARCVSDRRSLLLQKTLGPDLGGDLKSAPFPPAEAATAPLQGSGFRPLLMHDGGATDLRERHPEARWSGRRGVGLSFDALVPRGSAGLRLLPFLGKSHDGAVPGVSGTKLGCPQPSSRSRGFQSDPTVSGGADPCGSSLPFAVPPQEALMRRSLPFRLLFALVGGRYPRPSQSVLSQGLGVWRRDTSRINLRERRRAMKETQFRDSVAYARNTGKALRME